MHLFDAKVNFSCAGIIGEGMGPAVGAAAAFKQRGENRVAVSFIGEGAANQGAFHEALNLAAIWRVPVLFVIEDNAWGISVSKRDSTAIADNAQRAAAYGMPGHRITGNDPIAIFDVAGEAIARARSGDGPTLIEIETYRLEGHFMGDAEGYRAGRRGRRIEGEGSHHRPAGETLEGQHPRQGRGRQPPGRSEGCRDRGDRRRARGTLPEATEAFEKVFA